MKNFQRKQVGRKLGARAVTPVSASHGVAVHSHKRFSVSWEPNCILDISLDLHQTILGTLRRILFGVSI